MIAPGLDPLVLLAEIVLAAVFLLAGVTKLADRQGTREGISGFGVPAALARPISVALPFAELAVGAGLLFRATAQLAAVGGFLLLAAFTAGIAWNLARGRTPDCHCFGQVYSRPISSRTLVRNGTLAAVAAVVALAGPRVGVVDTIATLSPAAVALLVLLLLAAGIAGIAVWVMLNLLRQHGRLMERIEALEQRLDGNAPQAGQSATSSRPVDAGLPIGTRAPAFSLAGLYGETQTLDALLAGGSPALLLFTDPGCGSCSALLPEVARWQREQSADFTVALVSRGPAERNRAYAREHGVTNVLLEDDRETSRAYQAETTPSAVLVGADGRVATPLAVGPDAIRALVARTTGWASDAVQAGASAETGPAGNGHAPGHDACSHAHSTPARAIGAPAPDLVRPNLAGRSVDLADFRGSDAAVVFWNPACGFCQRMLPDLKTWEESRADDAPRVLVVSTGTPEANRQLNLSSEIVLDEEFAAGTAFGARGTPSAVIVDAEGRVASRVVAGAEAVLQLLRDGQRSRA